jgi:Mg-chelatase subunit ChlI
MERNLGFERDGEAFRQEWLPREEELSRRIEKGRNLVDQVTHTSRDLLAIAALTSSMNVEGHRSDLVILKSARAQAAFDGRTAITDLDIALTAELALLHRIKGGPFQQTEIGVEELRERIEHLVGASGETESEPDQSKEPIQEEENNPKKV